MTTDGKNAAEILLDYLELEGVDTIFGIPGGGTIELNEILMKQRDRFNYVICRQETGAGYIADGYFRASGKLGVVLVTTGPGATNALTGIMNAEAGHSRVLLLTGEIAEEYYGMGYLQEGIDSKLDVNGIYKNSVSSSAVVSSADNVHTLVEAALRATSSRPFRAAHISMPVNVTMATPKKPHVMPTSSEQYRTAPNCAGAERVHEALEMLAAAERPLLMLGNGCREALWDTGTLEMLSNFVTEHGIPVITTSDGKSIFPEQHEMSLGQFGLANSIWPYYWFNQSAPEYDLLCVIGSGLAELATNKWNPMLFPKSGKLIQVDANDQAIGKVHPMSLGVVGEAGAFLRAMCNQAGDVDWSSGVAEVRRAKVAEIKAQHSRFKSDEEYNSTAAPCQPAALCRVMQEEMPADKTLIFLDSCNSVGWGSHYLVAGAGFETHASLDMGPMGFAVGAVIGGKMARPDCQCLCLTGDGAFMMQGSEISTASQNRVGGIWVVLNDNDLGMVSQGMEHFMGGDIDVWRKIYALGNPDLVKYSEGLGADAYGVDNPEDFRTALKSAMAGAAEGRPQAIIVKVDRDAIPPYYNPLYAPPKHEAKALVMQERSK